MPCALIFDIDGTLLYARGIGRAAFGTAFLEAYGVPYPDIAGLSFVGATDSNVVRVMAAECGAAVATGWVSSAELADAGADLVLDDFSDTARAISLIDALTLT